MLLGLLVVVRISCMLLYFLCCFAYRLLSMFFLYLPAMALLLSYSFCVHIVLAYAYLFGLAYIPCLRYRIIFLILAYLWKRFSLQKIRSVLA